MGQETQVNPQNPNIQRYFISDFSGGLRLNLDSTKIQDTEYLYLQNMRNRFGRLSPVKLPVLANAGLPSSGKSQGLFGAGNFLLLVKSGIIYYRNFLDDNGYFRQLSDTKLLDPNVDTVYMELVPASTQNYIRQSPTSATGDITFSGSSGNVSPQVALIMDGINQALAISPLGAIRQVQTFNEWSISGNREYVPVGIMPLYINGILYIVSPSLKEIYHSVTGRPLDFVQAVDQDGNKLQDGLFIVEASRFSHKIDFEDITCIGRINTPDGSFFASTINNAQLVLPNRQGQLFFGEPGFDNVYLFPTGALNAFSLVDTNGDTALTDLRGIRSFNAVQQLKFEGNNSQFSNNVALYFHEIIQNTTASINFDNYAFFSVDSIYGPVIAVYDTLSKSWVGLDIYPGVGQIKQFAQIKIRGIHKLFCLDTFGNVYEMFSGNTASWQFYREWSTNNPEMEQKLNLIKCVFQNVIEDGEVSITDFSDRLVGQKITKTIKKNTINRDVIIPPFGDNTVDRLSNKTYKFPESAQGYKTGILVEGNNDLELTTLQVITESMPATVATDQQAEVYDTP